MTSLPASGSVWNKLLFAVIFVVASVALSVISFAAVSNLITVQGKLTNQNSGLQNGTFPMVFKLYTAETGGSAIYTEQLNVNATNGIFEAYLGSNTSLAGVPFDQQYYMGIQVSTDSEMTPRIRVGSSGYSFRSNITDYLNYTTIAEGRLNFSSTGNITFGGDTQIYRESAGDIVISGGAGALLRIIPKSIPTYNSAIINMNRDSTGSTNRFRFGIGDNVFSTGTAGTAILSESNSGIKFPILFMVDTTEVMRIGNNSNVGIGTTNPGHPLHVWGSSSSAGTKAYFETDGGGGIKLQINNASDSLGYGANYRHGILVGGSESLAFLTNGASSPQIVIDTSGNVGINTTSPTTTLDIRGNFNVTRGSAINATADSGTTLRLGSMSTSGAALQLISPDNDNINPTSQIFGVTDPAISLYRFAIQKDGGLLWGNGSLDTNLYRGAANKLATDDDLGIGGTLMFPAAASDVNLYRGAADVLKTDDNMNIIGNLSLGGTTRTRMLDLNFGSIQLKGENGIFWWNSPNNDNSAMGFINFTGGSAGGRILFGTNSGEKMRIDESGYVGIGTTSPTTTLHVGAGTDSATVTANAIITAAGTTNLAIRDSTNNVELMNYVDSTTGLIGTSTNHPLTIRTNNANVMTLLTNGNVGIGTTSPQSRLDVVGGAAYGPLNITNNVATAATTIFIKDIGQTNGWYIGEGGTGADTNFPAGMFSIVREIDGLAFVIDTSRNVGIGTSAPHQKVEINEGDLMVNTSSEARLRLSSWHSNSGSRNWALITNNVNYGDLDFMQSNAQYGDADSAGTSRLYIKNDGVVGIGTTSPFAKLDVRNSSTDMTWLASFLNSNNEGLFIAHSGVNSGNNYGSVKNATILAVDYLSPGAYRSLVFATSGQPRMIINSTGQVGIGTTAPNSSLTMGNVNDGTLSYLQIDSTNGVPGATDCDEDLERGRMLVDYLNNNLLICNGATRGWDTVALTN